MPIGSRCQRIGRWSALITVVLLTGCQGLAPIAPSHEASADPPALASASPAAREVPANPASTTALPPLPPEPEPTPLLDAALARARAIQTAALSPDRLAALAAEFSSPAAEDPRGPALLEPAAPGPAPEPSATAAPAQLPRGADSAYPATPSSNVSDPPEVPSAAPTAAEPTPPAASPPPSSVPTASAPSDHPAPAAPEGPLEIAELRLCRRVLGFGDIDPLDENQLRAGQPVILYCEMTGLRYERAESRYRSRLSARVAIQPEGGAEPVWDLPLGEADDHCGRPRRDYYVSYRFSLPASLPPGAYQLLLFQKDELAGRTTVRGLPLTILPNTDR
jgi:hypothetical protein